MRIKNVTQHNIAFSDLRIPTFGLGLPMLGPGIEAVLFEEDAARSRQLALLLLNGQVVRVSDEVPNAGTSVSNLHILSAIGTYASLVASNPSALTQAWASDTKQALLYTTDTSVGVNGWVVNG